MNAASLPLDPPSAVEGLATPNPLTLGQLALLEKIKETLVNQAFPTETSLRLFYAFLLQQLLMRKEPVGPRLG